MALTETQRIFAFLIGCMGARLLLVYATLVAPLKPLSILLGVIGLGFSVIWLMGWRKTGIETGGDPIWWNNLRPFHALAYLSAAALLWFGRRHLAAGVLFVDALVGLWFFLDHHKLIRL